MKLNKKSRIAALVASAMAMWALSAAANAAPPDAEILSYACAGCHGTDGASAGDTMPSLARQSEVAIVDAMMKFKSGERSSTIMGRLAKGYSDEQIKAMAGFFAKQELHVTSQPVDKAKVARGAKIQEKTCGRCHIEKGRDGKDDTPVMASQWLPYLQMQMALYDAGKLLAAGAGAAGLPMVGRAAELMPKTGRRVVVVGGGYGGTIAAKYIRKLDKSIEVVLIERNRTFVSCPFSNHLLAGYIPDLSSLSFTYDKLAANHGIKMVYGEVTAIDPAAKVVATTNGTIAYDRLVVAPGVDFRTEEIEGYDAVKTPEIMPHAWKAGPQTLLLRKQLEAMKDGGTVVLTAPLAPFRCPPGPYERAAMVADYLKKNKPKSKVLLLDANPDIVSKGALFRKGWEMHYPGLIEYRKAARVTMVDTRAMSVTVEGVDEVKGDVINVVPAQRASALMAGAGLVGADKRWCPVNPTTFESTLHKDIHVIGDACGAGAMPKSGYSANSEAKVCARNLVAAMNGRELVELSGINTCYSYLAHDEAISVAAVYTVKDGAIVAVPNSGGVSKIDYSEAKLEAPYAHSWLKNILTEMST